VKYTLGYHFCGERLRYTNGKIPRVGLPLKLRNKRKIRLCGNGLHASPTARQAFSYVRRDMTRLCLVGVRGEVRRRGDKFAGRERVIFAEISFDDLAALFDKEKPGLTNPRYSWESQADRKNTDAVFNAFKRDGWSCDAVLARHFEPKIALLRALGLVH